MRALLLLALVCCARASDTGFVKSVKGGGQSHFLYKGGDVSRFYGFNNTQHGSQNTVVDFEIGVCYVEVPTASLVKNPSLVPAGNGSRPDLSRIRSCCQGYKRNIYNFLVCDPICNNECVNGLCTAPETCTCYPDHVRNLAGICVATCPIGCQNGYCSGGECLCKEGYKLDRDSKFCIPSCGADCDRIGNCTAPNTCTCKPGVSHPVCHSNQPVAGNNQPSYPAIRPTQDTIYVNPDQHPSNPINSYNQKRNDSIIPNYPNPNPYHTTPVPQGHNLPNSPDQAVLPHQSNQEPIPQQFGQSPYYPTYPINQNYPVYPGSQISPNPMPNYGQQPQVPNNQFSQNPDAPNQGTFRPQYPPVQSLNVTYPVQYPLYPGNQVSPYTPNHTPNQGPINPYYPSGNQGPYPSYPNSQGGYPHPDNQQSGTFPHQGPSSTSPNSTYHQVQVINPYPSYPGGQNNPYSQQSFGFDQNSNDQLKDLSPSCSEPCNNGVCIENNKCNCNTGYVRDEDDATGRRCLPYCPGGCHNGYCASPYTCACNEGYSKDTSVKGRALCIKRIRRSVDLKKPVNIRDLLVFEIPDYEK